MSVGAHCTAGSQRAQARRYRLCRRMVALHHAEHIALSVLAVGEVAYAGYGHLGGRHRATAGCDLGDGVVDRVYADGVDRRHARLAPHERAVDPRGAGVAGGDQPVVLRAIPLLDLPAEDIAVELDSALGIIGAQLEMNDSRHDSILLATTTADSNSAPAGHPAGSPCCTIESGGDMHSIEQIFALSRG